MTMLVRDQLTIHRLMKKFTVLISVLICLSLSLGCSRKRSNAAAGAPEVLVAEVARKDVPVVKEWVATLDGLVNATITARVAGHLISQDYKEGTAVKKGDPLFQIDPRPFEEALAQAKATLAKAQATQLKADQDEKRAVELFNRKVTSEQERDTALQAAAASKGDTEADQAAVNSAELNLGYTKITAPIDGIAGFAAAQVGDLVGPSTPPLTTISQVDPIKAVVTAGEQSYTEFTTRYSDPEKREEYVKSVEFELVLANGSVYPQKGKFYAVDRNVDVKTGSIRFETTFPNPGNILRPGQFGRVRATTEIRKGALLVPQEAVTELQGNYQVAVIGSDNKASIRPVKVGDRFGAMWEITEGVEPGEQVVVQGIQKVREGAPVTAKRWMPPAETPALAEADKSKHP
jgi:RND family efflux transporter MFP subunit